MHFLFISSILGPTTGGIETLIARMSKWLLEKGHRITLLSNTASKFRELFPDEMRIVDLGDQLQQFFFHHEAKRAWPDLLIDRPDVIKSFHLRDSWISSILSSIIKPAPKVLFGNYFPYIFPQTRNPFKYFATRPYLLNLVSNFRDNSILCMDEEQICQFRQQYGNHRNPIFWPLPIEDPSKHGPTRTPKWCHIVSVGRLEPMKEYNFYMIDVVAKLRKKGYPVTWTVFGEGRFADTMRVRINALGLNEAIHLKGKLDYSRFAAAMQNAYLFVGAGTAAAEAAMCGVPTVVTFAYDSSGATYGSLYQFPFGNLGMRMDGIPEKTTIEDEIERIIKLRNHEYEKEIKRNRAYVKTYSMDISMNKFLGIVAKASVPKTSYGLFYYYYAHRSIELVWQKVKQSSIRLR